VYALLGPRFWFYHLISNQISPKNNISLWLRWISFALCRTNVIFHPWFFGAQHKWKWFQPFYINCNKLYFCYRVWFLLLFPKKRRLSKESTLFWVLICFSHPNCYIEPPYHVQPDSNQSDTIPRRCTTSKRRRFSLYKPWRNILHLTTDNIYPTSRVELNHND